MDHDRGKIQPKSIYMLLATNLSQAQKIGNYVKGYVDGNEKCERFLKEFCEVSNTKYIVRSSNKKSKEFRFSKESLNEAASPIVGTRYGHTERIYWEFNNRNLFVPFTGMPFVVNSSQIKQCQFGSQYYKMKLSSKESSQFSASNASLTESTCTSKRRHFKQSRKRNCPACLNIREIILFPDFSVNKEALESPKHTLRNEKLSLINKLRDCANPSTLKTIHRYFVELPLPEAHSDHPADASIPPIRLMNVCIKAKLDELLKRGRFEKKHIELIVQDFIKEEMRKNGSLSNHLESFPTRDEIRDYIYLSTISAPTIVEVHTKEYGSDERSAVIRTSSQKDMEKGLEELKGILQSCTDKEILWDVKTQVKKMIRKLKSSTNEANNQSSSLLGKRNHSLLDNQSTQITNQQSSRAEFSNQPSAIESTVQEINDFVHNHQGAPLALPQPSQVQFHTNRQNSSLPHAMTNGHTALNDTSMISFSRFMESNQEICPSLVDHVVTDSSHPTPPGNYAYFPQYANR